MLNISYYCGQLRARHGGWSSAVKKNPEAGKYRKEKL